MISFENFTEADIRAFVAFNTRVFRAISADADTKAATARLIQAVASSCDLIAEAGCHDLAASLQMMTMCIVDGDPVSAALADAALIESEIAVLMFENFVENRSSARALEAERN